MATALVMPALEMAQETGLLVRWLKQEGEMVQSGEPVMEVETDKATMEIESPGSGVLGGIMAKEGDVVPVGRTIAWLLAPGETPPEAADDALPTGRAGSGNRNGTGGGPGTQPSKTSSPPVGEAPAVATLTRTLASPKARRLARERGIDLGSVPGSGPGAAVLAVDLGAASAAQAGQSASYETPSKVWRVMAERMQESWTTVPHFYLAREIDAGRLLEWRDRSGAEVERRSGVKVTVTDTLTKAVAVTLCEHARLNGSWEDGQIRINREIHIGVAVALEDGLVVPVIRNADRSSLSQIAAVRSGLVARARERKLRPEDLSGGTFTITNLGMYHVDSFNPIINPPQSAILAVGRIVERAVPVAGRIEVRPMVTITLACDHRVVDGARAAQFLDALAETLQDPWRLLI